ncbi:MAG: chorismate mutase [Chloroflexi bacterium]|nr:chorismate mutase [Chloroflexota bacterium]
MSACLGLRGATTADANTKEAIVDATEELLRQMVASNQLVENDVAAVFFTTTRDLNAEFPAVAARVRMGWEHTALMNAHEMDVPDAATSVVRVLLLVNTDKSKDELVHVYLKGAQHLRSRGATQ